MGSVSSAPIDTTVEIETPEHVRFRYQVAGPGRRAGAYLVDLVVRGLILMAVAFVTFIVSAVNPALVGGFEAGAFLIVFFVLEWGYYVLCEMLMNGASIGKRALRLRVVQSDGLPITFVDSFLRNLVRAADILPMLYAVGLTSMALDSRFRRLGDLVAGTLVIHEPVTRMRRGIHGRAPAQIRFDLPERPQLSRDERSALALFVRRRPRLSVERAEELAELIAPPLAERFSVRYRSGADFLESLYEKASQR